MVTFLCSPQASAVSNTCFTASRSKPSLQPYLRKSWNCGRAIISRCRTNNFSTKAPVNRSRMRSLTWNNLGKLSIYNTSLREKASRNSPLIIELPSPDLHDGELRGHPLLVNRGGKELLVSLSMLSEFRAECRGPTSTVRDRSPRLGHLHTA